MPPGLWHFTESPAGGVYISVGNVVLNKYGTVKQLARTSNAEENVVKVVFSDTKSTKSVKLNNFKWSANDVSRKFQGCKTFDHFIEKYLELFGNAAGEQSRSTDVSTNPEPPKKHVKLSKPTTQSHKVLMPASRSQDSHTEEGDQCDDDDDKYEAASMDKSIQDHFKGFFILKVSSLKEPPKELLVRERNDAMVAALKLEMMDNPCNDVTPILCIVKLTENETFNKALKDCYHYITIGGNHSRQAIQELLNDHKDLQRNKLYTQRLCAVYEPMELSLARRLASKHNRATSFTHEMTSWDWIVQCRKLLYELSGQREQEDPQSTKPDGWKKACAAILALSVNQLDDRMIFFLASVPNRTFALLENIFIMYSKGGLKDQVVAKSKKGICSFLELKGSAFKPFRGLEASVVHDVLEEVSCKKCSFKEAITKCNDIKSLQKVQTAFIKATNCDNWDEACEKYPAFTTAQKLEPFKNLDFSNPKKVPEKFFAYCQHVIDITKAPQQGAIHEDQDKQFLICHENSQGLLWRTNMLDVCPEDTENALRTANVSRCTGFHLTLLDLVNDHEVSQTIKKYSQIIRAINYNRGLQDFTIVGMCCLKDLFDVSTSLETHCDGVQVAVCGIEPACKGSLTAPVYVLDEVSIGIVVAKMGSPGPLSKKHGNFFTAKADSFVRDIATKEVIYAGQKPLSLYMELIQVFSRPSDWIFNGPTGIGTCMIASLKLLRNCISVENLGMRFIHSKIRCVKELSSATNDHTEEHEDNDHTEEHNNNNHTEEHDNNNHTEEHDNNNHTEEHDNNNHTEEHDNNNHTEEHDNI